MKVIAAIDIGSHAMKLKIVEQISGSRFVVLEDVKADVVLGADAFRTQRITGHLITEAIKTLKYFAKLMKDYGVEEYRAVATEAIRRAQNGQFVIDQLSKKSGLAIEILEEPIERHLTYLSLKTSISGYKQLRKKGLLLVDVGSGSSEITIYRNNKLVRNQQLRIGTLQLKEIMRDFEGVTLHKPHILEDYVYANSENLQKYLLRKDIQHFAIVGGHIKEVVKRFAPDKASIDRKAFEDFYTKLFNQDFELYQDLIQHQVDVDQVLAAFIIFKQFLDHTACVDITVPEISLQDGLLIHMVESKKENPRYLEDVLSAASATAKLYYSNMAHIRKVLEHAEKIFQSLKGVEGLSDHDLFSLKIAIILHETGKFSKQSDYYNASYQNIVNASILGLSSKVMDEAAQIVLAYFWMAQDAPETVLYPYETHQNMRLLKLAAIQALADALDKSKKQRIKIKKVILKEDVLTLEILAEEGFLYEKWMVYGLEDIYKDLYGYEIRIKEVSK